MEQKAVVLQNKGMLRDLSISKQNNEFAYENFNIRILARDHDTLLSVTNERGNRKLELVSEADKTTPFSLEGTLIGYSVLNSWLVMFTTDSNHDHIYRIKYDAYEKPEWTCMELFRGKLNFDVEHPIETLAFYESEDIQKVYWVDGLNQPRLINIKGSESTIVSNELYTKFDFVTSYDNSSFHVDITRGNEGVSMPSGTRQYYVTYYNKYGQETHFIWQSPLLYSSFTDRGASPEESTHTSFRLEFTGLDTSFDYIRVYALTWTSLSTQPQADIVGEISINESGKASFNDTGVSLASIDPASVLYLGGDMISAGTISQKDNTLFLGDLKDQSLTKIEDMKKKIGNSCFKFNDGENKFTENVTWESKVIEFKRASDAGVEKTSYVEPTGQYPFNLQLQYPSSDIKGFKRGEKYRFAVRFVSKEGLRTQAFWIGDKENDLVPVMDSSGIDRIIAVCNLPEEVIKYASDAGYAEAELLMAQTSTSNRSVLCQGVVCPTLFNLEQRVNDSPFSLSSWIMRPRNSNIPAHHFQPLTDSQSIYSEIQNHYYRRDKSTVITPCPYYKEVGSEKILTGYEYKLTVYLRNSIFNSTRYTLDVTRYYSDGSDDTQNLSYGDSNTGRYVCYEYYLGHWVHTLGLPKSQAVTWTDWNSQVDDLAGKVPLFSEVSHGWSSDGRINIYGIDNSEGNTYAHENGEFFFIDESIVTFNSPELNSNMVIIDNNPSINFRIVGVSPITANSSDYTADITPGNDLMSDLAKVSFNTDNISQITDGLVSYPLWYDYYSSEGSAVKASYYYMLYMWHKSGSIIGEKSEDRHAVLNKKLFANRRFSYKTIYSEKSLYEYLPQFVRIYDTDQLTLSKISVEGEDHTYQGNCDFIIMRPLSPDTGGIEENNETEYPIYKTVDLKDDPLNYTSKDFVSDISAEDPVNIKFKSSIHAVIGLPMDEDKQIILPSVINDDKVKSPEENTIYFPWKNYDIDTNNAEIFHIWSNINSIYLEHLNIRSRYTAGGVDYIIGQFTNSIDYRDQFASYPQDHPIYGMIDDADSTMIILKLENLTYIKTGPGVILNSCFLYYEGYINIGLSFINPLAVTTTGFITISLIHPNGIYRTNIDIRSQVQENYRDAQYKIEIPVSEVNLQDVTSVTVTISSIESDIQFDYTGVDFIEGRINKALDITGNAESGEVTVINAPIYEFSAKEETVYTLYDDYHKSSYVLTVTQQGDKEIGIDHLGYYRIRQDELSLSKEERKEVEELPYVFIGELFRSFGTGKDDTRYGGINEAALENNTFISCGETTPLGKTLYGLEGDTYVQRYDFIKTMPMTDEDENQVLDITSVMLETHENLDGRYDNQRTSNPVNINYNEFNKINPVYSQQNSFIPSTVLDERYDLSYYPTQITWSEEKVFNEEIDTWTGIHLASSLQLDGDKGPVRAIKRFRNSLIAFQDKGICEILFNSRTQLSTTEGVPIEIANSGKVDGKRYVTDKSGCINKWSIIETPGGIYFIDNINSSISLFNGSVQSLSDIKGFKNWIGNKNRTLLWNPQSFDNFVTFWDRVNDDIYFIGKKSDEAYNTLCYNETLQQFTSFFDYGEVPMMVNVQDRFLAYRDGNLWLQNEGAYSTNLFGEAQDFHVLYRVTPDPYGDKIFSSIEYRADMFDTSDNHSEGTLTDHTFDTLNVWNEYQSNEVHPLFDSKDSYPDVRRKFRIWRMDMPRDRKHEGNPYGLNRMRNPWLYVKLTKHYDNDSPDERMVLHDVTVRYFE